MRYYIVLGLVFAFLAASLGNANSAGLYVVGKEPCDCSPLIARGIICPVAPSFSRMHPRSAVGKMANNVSRILGRSALRSTVPASVRLISRTPRSFAAGWTSSAPNRPLSPAKAPWIVAESSVSSVRLNLNAGGGGPGRWLDKAPRRRDESELSAPA